MVDLITCKCCLKRLPESCFYSKTQWKNGKSYFHYYHTCKKCISLKNKIKKGTIDKETLQPIIPRGTITMIPILKEKPKKDFSWVVRNLKRYGNCYVRKLSGIDIDYLTTEVGFQVISRRTSKENDGYILERKKQG